MFHENVYVGRWWETGNKEYGGTIDGVVTQSNEVAFEPILRS